ncbi:MAG: hypothetical protein LBR26_04045, partial [Prevotella sp.]|nr:hypothetical protein [Prevotella sp.]
MKTIHISIIFAFLCGISLLHAQEPKEKWELNAAENGNKTYIAREQISLKPGFSYKATSGSTFIGKIDQTLLFPPTGNTYAKPDGSITSNPALGGVVGAIPGQFSVSPSGAATYTIPIEVPSGINEMQPQISLVYNSQGGNGIAGWGWSIGGISAISRTGSTFYHDGKIATVELTNSDNLALDGQRLILVSGTHFTEGAKYRTEIEVYSEVTYKTINGFKCFEVITKEGMKMQYGASSDSYIEAQGSSSILTWLLTKVTDQNGNYITYSYGEDNANGEYWLSKISYTGNTSTGTSPVNEIEFIYNSNRADSQIMYMAGKKVSQTKTLQTIKTKTNSQVQYEYSFIYDYDGFYTKLSALGLKNSEGIQYNSTIIDWQSVNTSNLDSISRKDFPLEHSMDESLLFVDFNNDGYTDLINPIMDQATGLRSGAYVYMGWNVHLSNKGQSFDLSQSFMFEPGPLFAPLQLIPVDINKDGFIDIAEIRGDGYFDILLNVEGTLVRQNFTSLSFHFQDEFSFYFQDFDGDGNIELLAYQHLINSTDNHLYLYRINIAGNAHSLLSTTTVTYSGKCSRISNVNGDAKAEIFFPSSKKILEYDAISNKFVEIPFETNINSIDTDRVECMDINGDGKTDLFFCDDIMGTWKVMLSTGISFTEINSPITLTRFDYFNPNTLSQSDDYHFSDYNGDGKSDIFEIYEGIIRIYYFNGKDFTKEEYNGGVLNGIYGNRHIPYFDMNGDGKCDLIGKNHDGFSSISFKTKETDRQVNSITNGLNRGNTIVYKPITNDSVYSKGDNVYSYPVLKAIYPLTLVSEVNVTAGNFTDTKTFFYKGLKVHVEGKGLLGFDEFTENSITQGKKETTSFGYNAINFNTYPV